MDHIKTGREGTGDECVAITTILTSQIVGFVAPTPSFIELYQTVTKISDFLVIATISSHTNDVTTQNIESAITSE
jgi:hypothetical protein